MGCYLVHFVAVADVCNKLHMQPNRGIIVQDELLAPGEEVILLCSKGVAALERKEKVTLLLARCFFRQHIWWCLGDLKLLY